MPYFKMIFRLVVTFFIITLPILSFAQPVGWVQAGAIGGSGTDAGISKLADPNGNIYTGGRFSGTADVDPGNGVLSFSALSAQPDMFLVKSDSSGNLIWGLQFGGEGNDNLTAMVVDPLDHAVYITGYVSDTVDFDPGPSVFQLIATGTEIFMAKYDSSGAFLWAGICTGSGPGSGLALTIDPFTNDLICSGNFQGVTDFNPDPAISVTILSGADDVFISRYSSSGQFKWVKSFSGAAGADEIILAIAILPSDGSILAAGSFEDLTDFDPGPGVFNLAPANVDAYVVKLDSAGNFGWAKSWGGSMSDQTNAIVVLANGNIACTGYFTGSCDFDPGTGSSNLAAAGSTDVFLQMLDANGNFIRAAGIGGSGVDFPAAISSDANGDLFITGGFQGTGDFDPQNGILNLTSAGGYDIFLVKADSLFQTSWAVRNGTALTDYTLSMDAGMNGELILAGVFAGYSLQLGATTLTNQGTGTLLTDVFTGRYNPQLVTGLNSTIVHSSVQVFPNPVTTILNLPAGLSVNRYSIIAGDGRTVKNESDAARNGIDVSDLVAGFYCVILETKGGLMTAKFLKE